MLVLLEIPVLLPMKTVFDLPMTRNQILKRRRWNLGRIKTAHEVAGFIRQKFTLTANLLIKTQQRPTSRDSQLLTNKIGIPLFHPQAANLNGPLFLATLRSLGS